MVLDTFDQHLERFRLSLLNDINAAKINDLGFMYYDPHTLSLNGSQELYSEIMADIFTGFDVISMMDNEEGLKVWSSKLQILERS